MPTMRLFWSARSPFARKVTVAAHELGCADAIGLLPTLAMTTREDPQLVAANPLGQLPALVRSDGTILYDSHVICEWLDGRHDGALFPGDRELRAQALRREALADGALAVMLAIRAEERRPEAHRDLRLVAAWRARLVRVLDAVEADCPIDAAGLDIGGIATAVTLAYHDFRMAEDWRVGRPAVTRWFEQVERRPAMTATAFSDK